MADLVLLVTHEPEPTGIGTELEDPDNGYRITRADLEGRTYVHTEAGSDWLHGTFRTHSRLEEETSVLGVRVFGDTMSQLKLRRDSLFTLFDEEGYKLTFTVEGQVWEVWHDCGPADIQLEDPGTSRYGLMAPKPQRSYLLTIPHSPV